MDYIDYVIIKFCVLVALAFAWGVWRGVKGLPLQPGLRDTAAAPAAPSGDRTA